MNRRNPDRPAASRLAVLATILVIASCGGAASSAPPASPNAAATASPSARAAASPAACPSSGEAVAVPATPALTQSELPSASPTGEPALEPTGEPSPTATRPATPTPRPTSGADLAISPVGRAPADPAAAETAAASVNAFGLALFRQLLADGVIEQDGNGVVSPTSIALALAMARAGAKGDTATQMDAVLHTSGWDALGSGLNGLDQALASRDATWKTGDEREHALALRIVNAAFGQAGWKIERLYLDAIAAAFGAGLRLVDYANDYEGARRTINAWVNDQTKGRIPQLLPPEILTPLTRLVLVNAIYLKAEWEEEFGSDTRAAAFTLPDGSKAEAQMMETWGEQRIPYARGTGWQATELRYRGANEPTPLAMTLVLPDDLAAFERGLTAAQLARITGTLEAQRNRLQVESPSSRGCGAGTYPYAVQLFMPRFGIDTAVSLKNTLRSLGMPLAFGEGCVADFSGIHVPQTPAECLYVSDVVHQANIDVDERGTEAAAATAVIMGDTGGGCWPTPLRTITLRLDRPFLFFLRDIDTGAVLFMGHVTNPSAGRS